MIGMTTIMVRRWLGHAGAMEPALAVFFGAAVASTPPNAAGRRIATGTRRVAAGAAVAFAWWCLQVNDFWCH
jgi:hypothetical protein